MPKNTDRLSDDLRGLRALKGGKQILALTTRVLDRFIHKADQLEKETLELIDKVRSIGNGGTMRSEVELLQEEVNEMRPRYAKEETTT